MASGACSRTSSSAAPYVMSHALGRCREYSVANPRKPLAPDYYINQQASTKLYKLQKIPRLSPKYFWWAHLDSPPITFVWADPLANARETSGEPVTL
jgi:hypothetical protein